METTLEFCTKHGHGQFFKAWVENGSGEEMHCPACFPELLAELTEIETGLARKREANAAVSEALRDLAETVRTVLAKGKNAPETTRIALRHSLAKYDAALVAQAEAD